MCCAVLFLEVYSFQSYNGIHCLKKGLIKCLFTKSFFPHCAASGDLSLHMLLPGTKMSKNASVFHLQTGFCTISLHRLNHKVSKYSTKTLQKSKNQELVALVSRQLSDA